MVLNGNGNVFGLSWYLDAVFPNWCALVSGNYESGMPLTAKYRPKRLMQPTFSRELNVYGVGNQDEFLQYIANNFKAALFGWPNDVPVAPWKYEPRIYQQVDLRGDYSSIRARYSENVRRQLKKATALEECKVAPAEIIALFRQEKGADVPLSDASYTVLENLMMLAISNNMAWSIGLKNEQGLMAAGFFIPFNNKLLYLKGSVSRAGKNLGAMQAVFDAAVRAHAETYHFLDFGGSNQDGLAAFNRKFGAEDVTYHMLKLNKLPWPMRQVAARKWGI